jgi:hypothetical protein
LFARDQASGSERRQDGITHALGRSGCLDQMPSVDVEATELLVRRRERLELE